MSKTEDKQKVGRPAVDSKDRKQSYTVSLKTATRDAIILKYGSLTAALEAVPL